jgi:hypothetical protein
MSIPLNATAVRHGLAFRHAALRAPRATCYLGKRHLCNKRTQLCAQVRAVAKRKGGLSILLYTAGTI